MTLPIHVEARVQTRNTRLQRLGYADYQAYLHSIAWRDLKQRYLASGRPYECPCGATRDLEFHHLAYERVGGEELLDDLQPLCGTCHSDTHALERRGDIGLDLTGLYDLEAGRRNRATRLERDRSAKLDPIVLAAGLKLARNARALCDELEGQLSRDFHRHAVRIRHLANSLERSCLRDAQAAHRHAGGERRSEDFEPSCGDRPATGPDRVEALPAGGITCSGEMTCECASCTEERARLRKRGVRGSCPIPVRHRNS